MPTAAESFNLAWQHHQAGDFAQAERLYRGILRVDPAHADAWCFLGAACQSQANLSGAESAYRRAAELVPGYASALNGLGVLLAEQGKLAEAAGCFQQVIDHHPDDADAHNNLGLAQARHGHLLQAIVCYCRALQLQPDYAAASANLDLVMRQRLVQGDGSVAIPFQPGLEAARAAFDANQRGVTLAEQGRLDEAKIHFYRALELHPDHADALNNLASALILQEHFDQALIFCQQALRNRPSYPQAINNLGTVMERQNRLDDAVRCFQQAIQLAPTYAQAWYHLGNTFKFQARFDESLAHYDEAIRLSPEYAEAHWNRGVLWLHLGDYERGWHENEWRLRAPTYARRNFPQPMWDGSPLEGRTILLHSEQGLGDTFQFIRYAPLVRQRGGKVVVECQPALKELLSRAPGIDVLTTTGSPLPRFDCYAGLLSLPAIFRTTLANVPAEVPYLHADPGLVARWRRELSKLRGLKVGIAWQGNPNYRNDHQRSIALRHFASLAQVPGVNFISLQKGLGTEQIPELASQMSVLDCGNRVDQESGPFMDTAAIIKNLDLVISSDTAIPHLAGALGTPVWLALPLVPDWRWMLEREDCPWYPTMRLFRQTRAGQWDDVFVRIAEALKEVAGR